MTRDTETDATIHRRPDGSIDIDHYLERGRRARSEQAHRFIGHLRPVKRHRRRHWLRVIGL
jgi:hypothetical protein